MCKQLGIELQSLSQLSSVSMTWRAAAKRKQKQMLPGDYRNQPFHDISAGSTEPSLYYTVPALWLDCRHNKCLTRRFGNMGRSLGWPSTV